MENGPAVKRENLLAIKKMNLVQIQIKQTDLSLHAVLTTAVNTYHMMIVCYPKKQLPTITNKQASKLGILAQCGSQQILNGVATQSVLPPPKALEPDQNGIVSKNRAETYG